jgi:hypothetical protein
MMVMTVLKVFSPTSRGYARGREGKKREGSGTVITVNTVQSLPDGGCT